MVRLNKLSAASRQLDGAIMLYLSGGDPVCVTTLVHAAALILHDLVRHRAPERSPSEHFIKAFAETPLRDRVKDEQSYRKLLREGPNWLKHARDDADSEYDFYPDMPPVLMTIAIADSLALDSQTSLQEMFMAWMAASYGQGKGAELSEMAKHWFPFDGAMPFEQRRSLGHARAVMIKGQP